MTSDRKQGLDASWDTFCKRHMHLLSIALMDIQTDNMFLKISLKKLNNLSKVLGLLVLGTRTQVLSNFLPWTRDSDFWTHLWFIIELRTWYLDSINDPGTYFHISWSEFSFPQVVKRLKFLKK